MDENIMFVPVKIEALVVAANDTRYWKDDSLDYFTALQSGAGSDLDASAPDAISNSDQPAAGIHLHWAIPSALTHGIGVKDPTTGKTSKLVFPNVPNRWLVVRT